MLEKQICLIFVTATEGFKLNLHNLCLDKESSVNMTGQFISFPSSSIRYSIIKYILTAVIKTIIKTSTGEIFKLKCLKLMTLFTNN